MRVFELRDMAAGYGAAPVLRGFNLDIEDGEFISVIGPNGAGKSTLLKVLSRDIAPAGGDVSFRGRPLKEYRARSLARELSIVRQSPEETASFTVEEFIRMGRFPHRGAFAPGSGDDEAIIAWAAETAGVADLLPRRLTELSGGELQLVRIAHALAQNGRVILLDEPVTHLDFQHAVMIMDILWRLNGEGATVITVLHDINLASDYSRRIVGIKGGRIVMNGPPVEVLKYDRLEDLFDARCIVLENPTTGRPFVYPVPGYVK
ncbi:MAG: ABC transporter ATP-binding protein [Spirochaetes bacterium]|nr:ABC transporter ATP-binding protein [Spirochaetota bacterium]